MTKTILITGASSGIGEACARSAVEAGHNVVLAARTENKLNDLVQDLGSGVALAVSCDVTDPDEQARMFEQAADRFGSIDVVFANAGLGASSLGTEQGDFDNFREMVLVNNLGVTITAKLAIPHLKKSRGQFLLTGSRAAHVTHDGSVYGATKWFIRGYAKNLSAELAPAGVRVTNIEPGMVDTPFFNEAKPDALRSEDIARAFMYVISQPDHVTIADIQVFPSPR